MAVIYLRSTDGSDSDDGSTWALAKATMAAAVTAAGNGGTVYVSDNHAESSGSAITISCPATVVNNVSVICVDDSGNPEPPTARATTATVTVSSTTQLTINGCGYFYGVSFRRTTVGGEQMRLASSTSGLHNLTFEACSFVGSTTDSLFSLAIGSGGATTQSRVRWVNTTCQFASTGHRVLIGACLFEWEYTPSAVSGTIPSTLLQAQGAVTEARSSNMRLTGVDLSALGSGKNIFSIATPIFAVVADCKLGSSVAITTGTIAGHGCEVVLVNSDSADANTRFFRQTYPATETSETTIVRTGGASDGTTTFGRKVVTTANVTPRFPYESMWLERWNETTGSAITLTVETVTDNVTLTDAEAWLEVEYLGTSGFPLGSFTSDRVADPIFGTPANQTTSSETWTTTGLTTPVKQKLSVSVTPQEKGIVRARVCVAKASTTMYYDPKIVVT